MLTVVGDDLDTVVLPDTDATTTKKVQRLPNLIYNREEIATHE